MIIYKTTNLVNNKIYVGQDTKNNSKYLGSGKKLKLAIKKYGVKNFQKEILEEINGTQELLNEREQYWIKKLDSTNKKIGYNISFGGQKGWMRDIKHSKETKEQFSKKRKGKLTKEKNGMYGKKHKEESKKKMGRPQNGTKNGMYGKKHTKEAKRKNSEAHKGNKNNFFGKKHTKEAKEKMSKKAKGRIAYNRKKISINNIIFESCIQAAEFFKVSTGTITYRCKSNNFKNWNYID